MTVSRRAVRLFVLAALLSAPLVWSGGRQEGQGPAVQESGSTVTTQFDYTGFDALEVSSAFLVDLRQADSYSISVTVDKNFLSALQVRKVGNTLHVGFRPGFRLNFSRSRPQAAISLPTLTKLELSGACEARLGQFKSNDNLTLELSGASDAEGELAARNVTFELSGASHLTLRGSGRDLNADASGASAFDLEAFSVDNARVELSGASHGTVDTDGRLDLKASGASHLLYVGNPVTGEIDLSGASSLRKK
jgi:hypothetical protein